VDPELISDEEKLICCRHKENPDPPADKLVAQSLYRAKTALTALQLVKKFHAFYGT
jgi:hypothetical protein